MKSFNRFSFLLLLSLFCPFFVGSKAEASGTGSAWVSCTAEFLDWSVSPASTDSSRAVRRFVPCGTFYNQLSHSTSGYSVVTGNYGVGGLSGQYDWSGNSLGNMFNLLYDGEPTPYWQEEVHRFTDSDGILHMVAPPSLKSTIYLQAVYPSFSSSDYAVSTATFRLHMPDLFNYVSLDDEYTLSFIFNFPSSLVCTGYIPVPEVACSDHNLFNGSGVFVSRNRYVTCNGTFIPVISTPYIDFTMSFYMPADVDLSGFSLDTVAGAYTVQPTDSNIVSDSLTRFPGSSDMDASKGQLDGVISDYDKVEGSLFDSGQAAIGSFDVSGVFDFSTGIYSSIAVLSDLMIKVITAMGEFNVIYTIGVALVFFGMLIGLWRFFK